MSRVFAIADGKTGYFSVCCWLMHERTGRRDRTFFILCPAVVVVLAEPHNQRSTLQCDFDDHHH